MKKHEVKPASKLTVSIVVWHCCLTHWPVTTRHQVTHMMRLISQNKVQVLCPPLLSWSPVMDKYLGELQLQHSGQHLWNKQLHKCDWNSPLAVSLYSASEKCNKRTTTIRGIEVQRKLWNMSCLTACTVCVGLYNNYKGLPTEWWNSHQGVIFICRIALQGYLKHATQSTPTQQREEAGKEPKPSVTNSISQLGEVVQPEGRNTDLHTST